MRLMFRQFLKDENGAITVDWVVLTAALIGMGMVLIIPIAYSSQNSAQRVADSIANQTVGYGN